MLSKIACYGVSPVSQERRPEVPGVRRAYDQIVDSARGRWTAAICSGRVGVRGMQDDVVGLICSSSNVT